MDNIFAVAVDGNAIHPHELITVAEKKPDFLPQATLVRSGDRSAILYSKNDLIPFSAYGERQEGIDLGIIFTMLSGYLRCLIEARDRMLNTSLVSSDPEKGVFVIRQGNVIRIKALWGMDTLPDEKDKICRIIAVLSKRDRVMGAGESMKRMIEIIRSGNPSLKTCLAEAEKVSREWNRIVQPN